MSTSTRIGSEIAGYRLEALLGRGGMSVVYVAEHLRLGRKVALKLLAPALSHDESFRERFDRESRRAAEIDHPNIIPIYDAGEADGQLYIAMRYVIGSDLKTLIEQDGPLGVGRTLFILEQTAAGLDAAHARDLVHRDVKPANILIEQPSEHVYVTDFGVVKHTAASQGLTRTGLFIGTVDYAAPEQIEGLEVDARTDVYALGCVLYECLIGKGPFDRQGEVAVMHAHLTEAPPRLTGVRPDLPKGLDGVVERAMAKDKEERYASCEELTAAARAAALGRRTEARPLPDEAPSQAPGAAAAVGAAGAAASVAGAPAAESIAPLAHQTAAPPTEQPASAVTEQPVPPVAEQPSSAGVSHAGPPPSPPAGSSGGGDRRRLILIAAIAAVLAAAAAAVAVYFATRSDGSGEPQAGGPATVTVTQPEGATEPSSPATPPAEPPPAETAPPAAEPSSQLAPLETLVPADIWADCAAAPAPLEPGAQESAVCASPRRRGPPLRSARDLGLPGRRLDRGSLRGAQERGRGPARLGALRRDALDRRGALEPRNPGQSGRPPLLLLRRQRGRHRVDTRQARAGHARRHAGYRAGGRKRPLRPVPVVGLLASRDRQDSELARGVTANTVPSPAGLGDWRVAAGRAGRSAAGGKARSRAPCCPSSPLDSRRTFNPVP